MITIDKITDVLKHIDGFSAVIFDLDDTLYSEKEYVRSGFNAIERELGISSEELYDAFLNKYKAIDYVLEKNGKLDLKDKCLSTYRNHKPNINLYPGVKDMLKEIKSKGIKLGMITDGRPEGQNAKIDALGIRSDFDKIIITDALGGVMYRKPNVVAYNIMIAVFGNKICYVADNVEKDFVSAIKLGIKSIYFKNRDGIY